MQHVLLWRSLDTQTLMVADEWPEPVEVAVHPIITTYYFGTTVGFFYRNVEGFGRWYSSNICDLITAWRVAQILPRVKTLRQRSAGCDETLSGLVIAMGRGDRHADRMREHAKDLDVTVEELDALLVEIGQLWPESGLLYKMWRKQPPAHQDKFAGTVRQALTDRELEPRPELVALLEQCELRLRSAADQREYEDGLIAAGLDPSVSLRQLLIDIGVYNLAYTLGCGDFGEPSHFSFDHLDRKIMKELIGKYGFRGWIPLVTTAKQPDDPTAHYAAGGGGVMIYGSDFGDSGHPRVIIHGETKQLARVRWDSVTERFQLAVRPLGVEHGDEDVMMTIEELRRAIGDVHPLIPGQQAPWLAPQRSLQRRHRLRFFDR